MTIMNPTLPTATSQPFVALEGSLLGSHSGQVLLPEHQARLALIRCLVLDVDGIMTDGRIFWAGSAQGWTRSFNVRDGHGIRLLQKAGVEVAVLSGGESADVRVRMESLKIKHAYLGNENKLQGLAKIVQDLQLQTNQLAYLGDELFDLPVLRRVGFSATVPEAVAAVRREVHYVTEKQGGFGAVREVVDWIMTVQGLIPAMPPEDGGGLVGK